eukprot:TRINITY_DN2249_c0_g1_i1.p1 TRINITY_DN2249_c0_g1~~TRINITY_DN2249_c0_g1_i1.p1  ORF type:complete len:166 (-),score=51.18 TRINITY_DN2249_c0_g1_i1:8-505(-)
MVQLPEARRQVLDFETMSKNQTRFSLSGVSEQDADTWTKSPSGGDSVTDDEKSTKRSLQLAKEMARNAFKKKNGVVVEERESLLETFLKSKDDQTKEKKRRRDKDKDKEKSHRHKHKHKKRKREKKDQDKRPTKKRRISENGDSSDSRIRAINEMGLGNRFSKKN